MCSSDPQDSFGGVHQGQGSTGSQSKGSDSDVDMWLCVFSELEITRKIGHGSFGQASSFLFEIFAYFWPRESASSSSAWLAAVHANFYWPQEIWLWPGP